MRRKIIGMMILILFFISVKTGYAKEPDLYQVQVEAPDGQNGYYMTKPKVQIQSQDPEAVTYYQFLREDHVIKEGELIKREEVTLKEEDFAEGEQILRVWMEKKDIPAGEDEEEPVTGEEQKPTEEPAPVERIGEKEWRFLVDTEPPKGLGFAYPGYEEEPMICTNTQYELELQAEDRGSGLEGFYYCMGDTEAHLRTSGPVEIPMPYEGVVRFYAVDRAGNRSREMTSRRIVCDNEKPVIQMTTPKGNDTWYAKDTQVNVRLSEEGVGSGIRSYQYYMDGVLEGNVQVKEPGEKHTSFVIPIQRKTTGVKGIKVMVQCRDYAGNESTREIVVYLDQVRPEIQITGCEEGQITSQPVHGQVIIQDETRLSSLHMEVSREDPEGRLKVESQTTQNNQFLQKAGRLTQGEETQCETGTLMFEEDGIYQVKAIAVDCAGNISERTARVIVDQSNPVIRYVEELEGKELQEFQWGYASAEMIRDFTHYTYEMRLDQKPYTQGSISRREGIHKLVVKVKDAAGNEAQAKAGFTVDRTEPEIVYQGIEPEGIYEKEVRFQIKTRDPKDQIQKIRMDGEEKALTKMEKEPEFRIQEEGVHQVEVEAVDRAGNREVSELRFEITEEKTQMEKRLEPVKRNMHKAKTAVKKHGLSVLGKIGIVVGVLILLGILITVIALLL